MFIWCVYTFCLYTGLVECGFCVVVGFLCFAGWVFFVFVFWFWVVIWVLLGCGVVWLWCISMQFWLVVGVVHVGVCWLWLLGDPPRKNYYPNFFIEMLIRSTKISFTQVEEKIVCCKRLK